MLGTSTAAIHTGIHTEVIRIEADVSSGFPRFSIVGLPDSAVRESKLRIRSAFRNSGMQFPQGRITVNLTPANFRKRGSGLDLAIAIAILRASHQVPADDGTTAFLAELQLSGALASIESAVGLALRLGSGDTKHLFLADTQVVPNELASLIHIISCSRLDEVVKLLAHGRFDPATAPRAPSPPCDLTGVKSTWHAIDSILGRDAEKRLLAISAAGRHHLLLVGPPGIGKTLLASHLVDFLPDLDEKSALAVFARNETADSPNAITFRPPIRAPHHSLTLAGMIGGGSPPQPGEVTLAHDGVLLLDELFEFNRTALDALREPLVDHVVHLTRGGRSATLPADFLLVATANPCPCGLRGYGDCRCLESDVRRYWARCSGPLLDRIDLMIYLDRQDFAKQSQISTTSGRELVDQVKQARTILNRVRSQRTRHDTLPMRFMTQSAKKLFERIGRSIVTSERSRHQLLSVSQTIAALAERDTIDLQDLEEAIQLRSHPGKGSV
ncbi:YifB family Mg chelatase-like AAA ATPase [Alicyclobacillus dauci]|uniref:YifB family Mg chelatase-like AAA ATPase n=1 Tax=Alicyclobacillus dauci TaxID=1475485 RepID=A0ABY6YY38_9BACL|nr:YifB family Mg chelatase-like AAA ATPase [Alicyclobacillus dauci]WAH35425.1 YifB family Mg chelatase-like AAA ATPase [Alicyclobacillus dauci]